MVISGAGTGKVNFIKKVASACALILLVAGGGYYYWRTHYPSMYEFDYARDNQQVVGIFHQNWHWLITSDTYSPEFTLKYLAPNENRKYLGKLKITVLRQGNEILGFVAYYMKSTDLGFLLFLAVDKRYTRKKYGERLLRYGLQQLTQMGAQKIQLFCRTTNIPALTLYKRVGFYKSSKYAPEGFVYYEYNPLLHVGGNG